MAIFWHGLFIARTMVVKVCSFVLCVVGYSDLMDLPFDSTVYLAVTPTALAQVSWRFFFL